MKKNNELLIEILKFYEENLEYGDRYCAINDEIMKVLSEKDKKIVAGHIILLLDSGLIEGKAHRNPRSIIVKRITLKGHDFLSIYREADVWDNIKYKLKEAPVDTVVELGKEALTVYLRKKIGLS